MCAHRFREPFSVARYRGSGGDNRRGLYGHYRMGRTAVVTWMWDVLRAGSGEGWGRSRTVVALLGLQVRWWKPVVVFSGRPTSTSAHSAGVEREGGPEQLASVLADVLEQQQNSRTESQPTGFTLRAPKAVQTNENSNGKETSQ